MPKIQSNTEYQKDVKASVIFLDKAVLLDGRSITSVPCNGTRLCLFFVYPAHFACPLPFPDYVTVAVPSFYFSSVVCFSSPSSLLFLFSAAVLVPFPKFSLSSSPNFYYTLSFLSLAHLPNHIISNFERWDAAKPDKKRKLKRRLKKSFLTPSGTALARELGVGT